MDKDFLRQLQEMADWDFPDESSDNLSHDLPDYFQEPEQLQSLSDTNYRMPAYLKEQMIHRSRQPDMQPISPKRRRSKQMELFVYSCKVTAAVAAAFVMLFTVAFIQEPLREYQESKPGITENIQERSTRKEQLTSEQDRKARSTRISESLNEGSESFTDWLKQFPSSLFNEE